MFSGSNDFKLNLCYFSSFQIYWITGVIVGEEILVVILLRPLHAAPDSWIESNSIIHRLFKTINTGFIKIQVEELYVIIY